MPSSHPPAPLQAAPAPGGSLPALPGIDTVAGLRRMLNKPHLYERVLREFHQRFQGEADRIRTALTAGDVQTAERRAHSARGLAGTIAAPDLEAAAHDLEAGIKNGADDLASRLERFDAALRVVVIGIAVGFRL